MDPGEQRVEVLPGVFRTRPLAKTVFPLEGIPVVPTKKKKRNKKKKGWPEIEPGPLFNFNLIFFIFYETKILKVV